MRFIDEIEIIVASGKGGDGALSFRREAHVPRGGPDGGDGGRGGDLVLVASKRKNTLVDLRRNKRYAARNGQPGRNKNMTGARGEALEIEVPVGTAVYDVETDELLADLVDEGAEWRLPGGAGGLGNPHFKSASHRTPRIATPGEPGVEQRVRLELKLLADVGLLGFPNAGKSTLISTVSAARPRVADYPFTTLVPNLGVVRLGWDTSFVMADIPGLIEGASEGQGLGHQFLKHVERCQTYVHLVAADAEEGPVERYRTLIRELGAYEEALAQRPQIVVLSKVDVLDDVDAAVAELASAIGRPVLPLSAPLRIGVDALVKAIAHTLQRVREEATSAQPPC
jgi:GTP-binding protein